MNYKELGDLLMQFYNAGIIALAIVLLAIAIIVYPTLSKQAKRSSKKSFDHRVK